MFWSGHTAENESENVAVATVNGAVGEGWHGKRGKIAVRETINPVGRTRLARKRRIKRFGRHWVRCLLPGSVAI